MINRTFAISLDQALAVLQGETGAIRFRLDTPWALISVKGSSEPHLLDEVDALHPPENLVDSLFLSFDDVSPLFGNTDDNFVYFDAKMARRVISFLEEVESRVETVVVNCNAGVSRSTAICLFIVEKYGLDSEHFKKDHPYARPNRLVLEILREVNDSTTGKA